MSSNRFQKLDDLEMGDEIKIHFSGQSDADVKGLTIENPLETEVKYILEKTLDHAKGHDVDGIVKKKDIHFEVPRNDDLHQEYVIEIRSKMTGGESCTALHLREYYSGSPGNGEYSIHTVGFSKIQKMT